MDLLKLAELMEESGQSALAEGFVQMGNEHLAAAAACRELAKLDSLGDRRTFISGHDGWSEHIDTDEKLKACGEGA